MRKFYGEALENASENVIKPCPDASSCENGFRFPVLVGLLRCVKNGIPSQLCATLVFFAVRYSRPLECIKFFYNTQSMPIVKLRCCMWFS